MSRTGAYDYVGEKIIKSESASICGRRFQLLEVVHSSRSSKEPLPFDYSRPLDAS